MNDMLHQQDDFKESLRRCERQFHKELMPGHTINDKFSLWSYTWVSIRGPLWTTIRDFTIMFEGACE